jgi:hypothetical protein
MNIVKSIKKRNTSTSKENKTQRSKKIYTQSSLGHLSKAQVSQIDL